MTRNNSLVISIIAALGISNIAFGLLFQVLPQAMAAEGDSNFLIGLNGLFGQLGVLIMGLNLPRLRQRYDSHSIVMVGIGVILITLGCFAATSPIWWWFPIRFVTSLAMGAIFTTGESWLQNLAGDNARARVLGTYMTCQTLTFAVGPFVLPYTGVAGPWPWVVMVFSIAAGMFLLSRIRIEEIATNQVPAQLWPVFTSGWFLFLCIASATLFDGVMLNFFVLYAEANGVVADRANQLLSFSLAMCMFFFFGIGWLSDHWSRRGMVLILALVEIATSLMQINFIGTVWIWPLAVVLRSAAFGVYLCGFGMLGDRFKGTQLVAATSVVTSIWGVGAGIGPPIAGRIFDTYGIHILPWIVAACYLPVLVGLVVTVGKAKAPATATS